jgi:pre-mRNA-splicing factor CDC5/CEF1
LILPGAQVGEAELEDIVKIGQASESAKGLVAGGSEASGRLLSDYEGLENARMARTPRTAPQRKCHPFVFDANFINKYRR